MARERILADGEVFSAARCVARSSSPLQHQVSICCSSRIAHRHRASAQAFVVIASIGDWCDEWVEMMEGGVALGEEEGLDLSLCPLLWLG